MRVAGGGCDEGHTVLRRGRAILGIKKNRAGCGGKEGENQPCSICQRKQGRKAEGEENLPALLRVCLVSVIGIIGFPCRLSMMKTFYFLFDKLIFEL